MPDLPDLLGSAGPEGLNGRRCESCGGTVPPRMHRQTRPGDGAMVCPSCMVSGVQPWGGTTASGPVVLDDTELAELRARMAAAQQAILRVRPERIARATRYRMTPQEAAEHLRIAHGWTPEEIEATHPNDLHGNHVGLHELSELGELAPPRHTHVVSSLQALAHESSDDLTCSHCPWCGSGQVTGLSDGSIECGYCQRVFTVRLEPAFPAMPQSIDGVPYPPGQPGADPGMPGDEVPGQLPPGMEEDPAVEGGVPPEEGPPGAEPAPEEDDLPSFMKGSTLRTAAGDDLPPDAYLRHLAVVESGYAEGVLDAVRQGAVLET